MDATGVSRLGFVRTVHRVHCPACGQQLPLPACRFPHVRGAVTARLVELIADNPGIGSRELMNRLYVNTYGGGPSAHPGQIISNLVANARKRLRLDGYVIDGSRGKGGGYRIRPLP